MDQHRQERWPGDSDRRSQLGRAALDVAATVGFEAMTMRDIADTAGVVRRTVNRYFSSKEAVFTFGYEEAIEELRGLVQAAYDAGRSPYARAHDCLEVIARFLAEDPARAQALVVAGYSAGADTVEMHRESMHRMASLIQHNARELMPPGQNNRVLAEMAAGGIYGVIFARTLRGQVRELPDLVPEWTRAVISPYVVIAQRFEDEQRPSSSSPCVAER